MMLVITGASGFLGRRLTQDAAQRGVAIRALSRRGWTPGPGVQGIACDVLDVDGLRSAMEGATHVVHAAGLAHIFGHADASSDRFERVNAVGTENVLRAAVLAGVNHVVHVSSVSVYGPHTAAVCTEDTPCKPVGPYATSKFDAEQRARATVQGTGTALTMLRLATLYGEEDPGNVARLMRAIDRGRFVWIGDGSTWKSLIHRDDAARACVHAVLAAAPAAVSVFNVSAPAVTMQQVVSGLADALDRRVPEWRVPGSLVSQLTHFLGDTLHVARAARVHDTVRKWLTDDVYDGSRFDRTFDFRADIALRDGLAREAAWHRANAPTGAR